MAESTAFDVRSISQTGVAKPGSFRRELPYRVAAVVFGGLLGLSAPGFEQWYLPWFLVAPLLVLAVTAKEPWTAGVRGWFFGTAYNLVYLSWYLDIRSEYLAGTLACSPTLMRLLIWISMSFLQGLFISIVPCLLNAIPLTGGWLPVKHYGRWRLPAMIFVPFIWLLVHGLCNNPLLLGIPWTSLEYSQYKQLPIIQSASLIGGLGITACILLFNLTLVGMIGFKKAGLTSLSYTSKPSLIFNSTVTISILLSLLTFGILRLESEQFSPSKKVAVTAVQANLATRLHKVTHVDIMKKYFELCRASPAGNIVIWPEWALLYDFTRANPFLREIAKLPGLRHQSWIVGGYDTDERGQQYNSVCAMDRDGTLLPTVYHKRYLVPFGEFTPEWARETPIGTLMYGFDKRYDDAIPGDEKQAFKLKDVTVGAMLCMECMLPKLSANNVHSGAQLLVDCSNTSWFHKSIVSDQLIASCTIRAVENHRSFVFSTGLGPSAIIDSSGRILQQAPREQAATISAEVPIEDDLTPFTRWCF